MKRWFVVHTQPRMEAIAVEHLGRLGFASYLPRYHKRRSHAGRVDLVSAPLFPRYVFIAFDPDDGAWRAIRSTRGAIDVVRAGTAPAQIDESIVDEIRRREDGHGHVVLARQFEPKAGDKIKIEHGALANRSAIFSKMKDSERVIALLSLLGREHSVVVPIGSIAPAL